ncbi:hypothetical protein ACH492_37805 [Streptomyces sp. NPDC019443]|uniref:hypothetical protein n=1 Tax=Streptomyces sp. NPDC019443 TaxID=3365061 RepID=UPI0037A14699
MAAAHSKALMWAGFVLCVAGAAALATAAADLGTVDPPVGVAGGIGTLIGLALTVHALYRHPQVAPPAPPAPQPTPPVPGGGAVASGHRSVAAGGGISNVTTGDA